MENNNEFNKYLKNSEKDFAYNSNGKEWDKDLGEFYAYITAKLAYENNQLLKKVIDDKN